MRNWRGALEWYRKNNTAAQIGFNPDGMCLKVCRTARDIPARYLTAKEAQDATPKEHRVYRVRDLRKGMFLFFDDPNDSNKAGHIVTMIGRVKGFDWDNLDDVLVETNSVVRGRLVVVRATYFTRHWGDPFQFGATMLNGYEIDYPQPGNTRVKRFKRSGPRFDVRLLDDAIKKGHRSDLRRYVSQIEDAVSDLPDDPHPSRVVNFKKTFAKSRIIDMVELNDAVNKGDRDGIVKQVRNRLNGVIKSVPPA